MPETKPLRIKSETTHEQEVALVAPKINPATLQDIARNIKAMDKPLLTPEMEAELRRRLDNQHKELTWSEVVAARVGWAYPYETELVAALNTIDSLRADVAALREGIKEMGEWARCKGELPYTEEKRLIDLANSSNPGQALLDDLAMAKGTLGLLKAERDALAAENARLRERLEAAEEIVDYAAIQGSTKANQYLAKYVAKEKGGSE